MSETQLRLAMRGINKSFAGIKVVADVGFEVGAGEVVALLGANGAGKSTLMKILCGVYRRDGGIIQIDGLEVDIQTPADAVAAGVRLIPQEISIHPDMTVAENISLGALPVRRRFGLPLVDRRAMRKTAAGGLSRLGLGAIAPERRMGDLSLPEQRVVEIARALAGNARILVMDEPTAALSEAEAEVLFSVVAALKREGVSIIYISHYLDEVFRLTDRIVVLRDSRVAGLFETARTSREAVLEAMLGSRQGAVYPDKPAAAPAGPARLQVQALSLAGWLDSVSFSVRGGEIVGVFGLIGSGVEKIGRAVFGAEPRARFERLTLDGRARDNSSPAASVASGVGFVAAERKREGLVGILTVRENTTAPFLHRFTRGGLVDIGAEKRETRRWIDLLHVRTSGTEQEIRLLSGGNQQKICLARWLAGDVKVLILEEPTRGVDLGARREIYAEIRRLAEQGVAVLVVSSDAEEVAGLADRVLVLNHGRLSAELSGAADARQLTDAAGAAQAA
jgi:ribose transport system ATP-binding protein